MRSATSAFLLAALLFYSPLVAVSSTTNESVAKELQMRLQKFGPDCQGPERNEVLLDIDKLFMNDSLQPLKVLLDNYISTAIWEISSSPVTTPTIWYFWNMGYILKTRNHVIGFDLPEVLLHPLSGEQKRILGESLDVFFVSHVDIPHVDRDLVSFMRKDSYLVCPKESVGFFDLIIDRKCRVIGMEIDEKRTIGPVDVQAYFGDDRRGTPMRCYLASVDGVKLLHTGDQHYVAEWMKSLRGRRPDVLMIGPLEQLSWTAEAINVIRPAYALPGALYDMSHPEDTWDGFPYACELIGKTESDVVPMFFGEMLQIKARAEGNLPAGTISVIAALVIGGGAGVAILSRKRHLGDREDTPAKKRQIRCEKRYVEELCLTCKYYAIKGGRPYCTKYDFELDTENDSGK